MPNNNGLWAIEIKSGLAPKLSRGFHQAIEDLKPDRAFIVYSGTDKYPITQGVEAIGLHGLATLLVSLKR